MEQPDNGISRRRMIKRIGAGTAVVWSAPALTTLGSRALAQGYPDLCTGCDPDCNVRPPCSADCVCLPTTDGQCFCTPGDFNCAGLESCGAGGACPSGFECIQSSCCGGATKCFPECA
jgi:hypothetical protein